MQICDVFVTGVSVGPGSWVVGYKSWVVGPKSWVVGSKSWVVGPKSWVVVGRGRDLHTYTTNSNVYSAIAVFNFQFQL